MSDPGAAPEEPQGVEWGGLPSPALVRAALGLLAGIAAASLGAKLLGEYQFDGALPYGAGALFGLVVGEVVVEIGKRRTVPVALVSGTAAASGLLWAAWISAGEGLEPIPAGGWIAAVIGFVAAAARTVDLARYRKGQTSSSASSSQVTES